MLNGIQKDLNSLQARLNAITNGELDSIPSDSIMTCFNDVMKMLTTPAQ